MTESTASALKASKGQARCVPPWHMVAASDRCLLLVLTAESATDAHQMACSITARLLDANLSGVTDVVPSMRTVGVHYEPAAIVVESTRQMPFDALVEIVSNLLDGDFVMKDEPVNEVLIPVCYGGEYGPDLDDVAASCGLSVSEVIALHSGVFVDVLMLGFAPGHPYVGTFDPRLAVPRRSSPRTAVPKGSIGLANRQTVIYPMTLPGGWSVIGRTPLTLFDPYRERPCLLSAGDRVRFQAISEAQYIDLQLGHEGAQ